MWDMEQVHFGICELGHLRATHASTDDKTVSMVWNITKKMNKHTQWMDTFMNWQKCHE